MDRKGYLYEYFFLIVLPQTYTFSQPRSEISAIFGDFPKIVQFWDNEVKKERELEEQRRRRNEN